MTSSHSVHAAASLEAVSAGGRKEGRQGASRQLLGCSKHCERFEVRAQAAASHYQTSLMSRLNSASNRSQTEHNNNDKRPAAHEASSWRDEQN